MRRVDSVLPLSVGATLAGVTGTVVSAGTAVPIALTAALVLGGVLRRRPFRVGWLLMVPMGVISFVLLAAERFSLALLALVADAGAAVLFGLVAAGGAILGEVLLGERAPKPLGKSSPH